MGFKRAIKIFRHILKDTEKYRGDRAAAGGVASEAGDKADRHKGAIASVFDDLKTFTRMVKAWAGGRYRAPWKSMAWIIAGIVYFVSPIDAIPDFIPIIGFMDDAFVITLVMRGVRKDVERFRDWESGATFDLESPPVAAHS